MNEILLDDFCMTGEGKDFLAQTARYIDEHTEVSSVNLEYSYLYYYMGCRKDGMLTFLKFIPGDEYTQYDEETGNVIVNMPQVQVPASALPEDLLQEIKENPEQNALFYVFDEDGDMSKPYISSKYLTHTASAKIPAYKAACPANVIDLASFFGDTEPGSLELYAVARRDGDIRKLVGFFSTNARTSLTKLSASIAERPCRVSHVKANQQGLSFIVTYYDEAERIYSAHQCVEDMGLTPCFVVKTSDTGFTNSISAAWINKDDSLIVLKEIKLEGDIWDLLDQLEIVHTRSAIYLKNGSKQQRRYTTVDEFVDEAERLMTASSAKLGKKTFAELKEKIAEMYKPQLSKTDFLMLMIDAITGQNSQETDYKKAILSRTAGEWLVDN